MEYKKVNNGFVFVEKDKEKLTPKKNTLSVPTEALAKAIAQEWQDGKSYTPKNKPLTAIAYTALDVISTERESMLAALLAYAETDLLCYRAENKALQMIEHQHWQPVIEFIQHRYECHIVITHGIMPAEQSEHTIERLSAALNILPDMELSAMSVLVQIYGSLLLALAVYEKHLSVEEGFALSRVDEDFQAKEWGVDEMAKTRAENNRKEVLSAWEFLSLL